MVEEGPAGDELAARPSRVRRSTLTPPVPARGDRSETPGAPRRSDLSDFLDTVPPRGPPAPTGADGGGFEPTRQQLRISIRLLLHIARQGRFGPDEVPPASLTQAGMAAELQVSQGAVSNSLSRLVDGGVLTVERSHVARQMIRVKVYRLSPRGEELARRLRERFGP